MSTTLQNFYKQTLLLPCTSGATTIYVSTKPTTSSGWLVISPNNSLLREIITFTATGTDITGDYITVSARGVGGTTAQAHSLGEPIRMNITAQHWADIYVNPTFTGTVTVPTPSNATDAATKAYADGLAIAGAPDASASTKGITKMSVAPVSPTAPIAVGDNDTRVSTQGENDAQVGNNTDVAVGTGNKFVTQTGLEHNAEKYAVDTSGSSTAYVAALSPIPTSVTDGMHVYIKFVNANTTTTPTLALNGLTARTIVKTGGTALAVGDISANMFCDLVYDLTNTRWILQTPVAIAPLTSSSVPTQTIPFFVSSSASVTSIMQTNQDGSIGVIANYFSDSSSAVISIKRLARDSRTNQYYITHIATITTASVVIDSVSAMFASTYVYIAYRSNGTFTIKRLDVATLLNETAITISGATGTLQFDGGGFSDGTNLYLYKGTASTAQKYTISGTTATNAADILYTSSNYNQTTCDGTNVWISLFTSNTLTILKYPVAGGASTGSFTTYLYNSAFPNNGASPQIMVQDTAKMGIAYFHSACSATAIIGYIAELSTVTLP